MKPINIDDNLHQQVKMRMAATGEKMYDTMNRYTRLGLWYDSLNDDQKEAINEEVENFLIDKKG